MRRFVGACRRPAKDRRSPRREYGGESPRSFRRLNFLSRLDRLNRPDLHRKLLRPAGNLAFTLHSGKRAKSGHLTWILRPTNRLRIDANDEWIETRRSTALETCCAILYRPEGQTYVPLPSEGVILHLFPDPADQGCIFGCMPHASPGNRVGSDRRGGAAFGRPRPSGRTYSKWRSEDFRCGRRFPATHPPIGSREEGGGLGGG